LSYYLDNRVINLDGVINEHAHFHLKNKSLDSYLLEQAVEYIVEEEFLSGCGMIIWTARFPGTMHWLRRSSEKGYRNYGGH